MQVSSRLGAFTFVVATIASAGAMAQTAYQYDAYCRQYADSAVAPMRNQAAAQGFGSALVGAGLGAALGAAVGGGRGAGIGAASGAIAGTGVGVANAQYSEAYVAQQYNAYYSQCMAQYSQPQPTYSQGYAPSQAYAPPASTAYQQPYYYQQAPQQPAYPYGYSGYSYPYGYAPR